MRASYLPIDVKEVDFLLSSHQLRSFPLSRCFEALCRAKQAVYNLRTAPPLVSFFRDRLSLAPSEI